MKNQTETRKTLVDCINELNSVIEAKDKLERDNLDRQDAIEDESKLLKKKDIYNKAVNVIHQQLQRVDQKFLKEGIDNLKQLIERQPSENDLNASDNARKDAENNLLDQATLTTSKQEEFEALYQKTNHPNNAEINEEILKYLSKRFSPDEPYNDENDQELARITTEMPSKIDYFEINNLVRDTLSKITQLSGDDLSAIPSEKMDKIIEIIETALKAYSDPAKTFSSETLRTNLSNGLKQALPTKEEDQREKVADNIVNALFPLEEGIYSFYNKLKNAHKDYKEATEASSKLQEKVDNANKTYQTLLSQIEENKAEVIPKNIDIKTNIKNLKQIVSQSKTKIDELNNLDSSQDLKRIQEKAQNLLEALSNLEHQDIDKKNIEAFSQNTSSALQELTDLISYLSKEEAEGVKQLQELRDKSESSEKTLKENEEKLKKNEKEIETIQKEKEDQVIKICEELVNVSNNLLVLTSITPIKDNISNTSSVPITEPEQDREAKIQEIRAALHSTIESLHQNLEKGQYQKVLENLIGVFKDLSPETKSALESRIADPVVRKDIAFLMKIPDLEETDKKLNTTQEIIDKTTEKIEIVDQKIEILEGDLKKTKEAIAEATQKLQRAANEAAKKPLIGSLTQNKEKQINLENSIIAAKEDKKTIEENEKIAQIENKNAILHLSFHEDIQSAWDQYERNTLSRKDIDLLRTASETAAKANPYEFDTFTFLERARVKKGQEALQNKLINVLGDDKAAPINALAQQRFREFYDGKTIITDQYEKDLLRAIAQYEGALNFSDLAKITKDKTKLKETITRLDTLKNKTDHDYPDRLQTEIDHATKELETINQAIASNAALLQKPDTGTHHQLKRYQASLETWKKTLENHKKEQVELLSICYTAHKRLSGKPSDSKAQGAPQAVNPVPSKALENNLVNALNSFADQKSVAQRLTKIGGAYILEIFSHEQGDRKKALDILQQNPNAAANQSPTANLQVFDAKSDAYQMNASERARKTFQSVDSYRVLSLQEEHKKTDSDQFELFLEGCKGHEDYMTTLSKTGADVAIPPPDRAKGELPPTIINVNKSSNRLSEIYTECTNFPSLGQFNNNKDNYHKALANTALQIATRDLQKRTEHVGGDLESEKAQTIIKNLELVLVASDKAEAAALYTAYALVLEKKCKLSKEEIASMLEVSEPTETFNPKKDVFGFFGPIGGYQCAGFTTELKQAYGVDKSAEKSKAQTTKAVKGTKNAPTPPSSSSFKALLLKEKDDQADPKDNINPVNGPKNS